MNARNLGGSRVDVGAFGQYYEFPQEDYFGLGMDSLESNRTNYLLDAIESGGAVRWKPSQAGFRRRRRLFQSACRAAEPTADSPRPRISSAAATAPGLGTATDFIKVEAVRRLRLARQPLVSAQRRQIRSGASAKFDDRDLGQFDFYRVDVHLQHYVPLASRYRVLALRAIGAFTNADSGQSVPFYLQPTLGGHRRPARIPRVALSRREQLLARRGVPLGSVVGTRWRSVRRCRHGRAVSTGAFHSRNMEVGLRHRIPLPQ